MQYRVRRVGIVLTLTVLSALVGAPWISQRYALAQDDSSAPSDADHHEAEAAMHGDFSGNWNGTIHDSKRGDGTLELILTKAALEGSTKGKPDVEGPGTAFFNMGGGGDLQMVGFIFGLTDEEFESIFMPFTVHTTKPCKLRAIAILASPNEMKAMYRIKGCKAKSSGTWDLTK